MRSFNFIEKAKKLNLYYRQNEILMTKQER
jgi:hypothetical protein